MLYKSLTTQSQKESGFTLIELLVVITIIATLAVVVFVALNPAKRLADARDARRTADVDTILTAIHQSIVDNKGSLPTNMPSTGNEAQLGTAVSACGVVTGFCNTLAACTDLTTGANNVSKYLKNMPTDPNTGTSAKTGYSVKVDANGIVTVSACGVENLASFSASR